MNTDSVSFRVSVCMATFNAGLYLAPQVESILSQLGGDDELVVSDDGSRDGTLEALSRYAGPNVRVYRNRFRHVTKNFEFALQKAKGRFIFLSDQDDEWHPSKLNTMLAALEDCDLVLSDCEVVDEGGSCIAASYFAVNGSRLGLAANLWRNSYLGCCMAFRRSLLDCALPIPEYAPHDMWIGLVSELVGRPRMLQEPLMRFRRHGATSSYAAVRSQRPLYVRAKSRLSVAAALAARYIRCRPHVSSLRRA